MRRLFAAVVASVCVEYTDLGLSSCGRRSPYFPEEVLELLFKNRLVLPQADFRNVADCSK